MIYDITPQRCTIESYFVKKTCMSVFGGKNSLEDTQVPTGANEQNYENNRACTLALAGSRK